MYDILVFKHRDYSYVTMQSYEGRVPPSLTHANFEGEKSIFNLTIHEYKGGNYLLAHEYPLPKDIADAAIEHYRPDAM